MGQTAIGVILGVKPTKAMKLWDEGVGAVAQYGDRADPPTGTECGKVVGYFVTVHKGGSEHGASEFDGEALSFTKIATGPDAKRARKQWAKFSAWMTKRGHEMPEPELFMVGVDVG